MVPIHEAVLGHLETLLNPFGLAVTVEPFRGGWRYNFLLKWVNTGGAEREVWCRAVVSEEGFALANLMAGEYAMLVAHTVLKDGLVCTAKTEGVI